MSVPPWPVPPQSGAAWVSSVTVRSFSVSDPLRWGRAAPTPAAPTPTARNVAIAIVVLISSCSLNAASSADGRVPTALRRLRARIGPPASSAGALANSRRDREDRPLQRTVAQVQPSGDRISLSGFRRARRLSRGRGWPERWLVESDRMAARGAETPLRRLLGPEIADARLREGQRG